MKVRIQAYGQRDPVVEYKFAGFDMFNAMIDSITEETVKALTHIKIEQKVEREQVAKVTGTNKDESQPAQPKRRTTKKVQPNDPCPCGSGRKYKQCCDAVHNKYYSAFRFTDREPEGYN